MRSAWQAAYLRSDGRTAADTQASYVRALSFDLIPDEMRDAAASRLVELIRSADTHLRTGFLSTGDLLPVLADTGHADVAYDLLFQRTAPSWLHMLDRGATTIWEDWEGIDEFGVAHESLNHYSKGAVIRFLHTHTLGLRQAPGSVAWESVVIEPVPGPSLTWASGSHEGPAGDHPGRMADRGRRVPHLRRASGSDIRPHRLPRRHQRRGRSRADSAVSGSCRIRPPPWRRRTDGHPRHPLTTTRRPRGRR